jgi:hypothetical protein
MPRTITLAADLPARPARLYRMYLDAKLNVADSDFAGVSEGWAKYYFIPWRAYLEGK